MWKQVDWLRLYCSSGGKMSGAYDCHWCCSPPISNSPLSGNTVGFHSSTPFEVRHDIFKTYFGQ